MVENFPFLIPMLMAFSSALHCLGMCGGIAGAMAINLPAEARTRRGGILSYLLMAHAGRLCSYALAGWLTASFGHTLFLALSPRFGHLLLQGLAAVLLIGTGLFLIGRFPGLRWLESLGAPLWQRLEPLAMRLITPQSLLQVFWFGVLWGWLPCSMVYTALIWSTAACSPGESVQLMLWFGLGTLPATLPAGWAVNSLTRLAKKSWFRHGIAVSLIGVGIVSLLGAGDMVHNPFMHQTHAPGLCSHAH